MRQIGEDILVVLAIFPVGVGGGIIVGLPDSTYRVVRLEKSVVGLIEMAHLSPLLRKILEIFLSAVQRGDSGGGGDTDDSVRPEKVAIRIDHPPFAVHFLYPEMSCGLKARAVLPTAVTGPVAGSGVGPEIFLLLFPCLAQVLIAVGLARPILVLELSIPVHKREETGLVPFHPRSESGFLASGEPQVRYRIFRTVKMFEGVDLDHLDRRQIDTVGIMLVN